MVISLGPHMVFLLQVSVLISFFYGRQACWIRAYPKDLILPSLPFFRPYFQMQS